MLSNVVICFICLITSAVQQNIDFTVIHDLIKETLPNIDSIVSLCELESVVNQTLETKYAQKTKVDKTIPALDGFQNKILLKRAFDKSVRQRPFECIAEKTRIYKGSGYARQDVESSPFFQKLQKECLLQNSNPTCDELYLYRSIDGTCNNIQNPKWGSVLDRTKRLLPHFYQGVAGFRQSAKGGPLPNARILSVALNHDGNRPSHNFTSLFAFFGQFLDHDIADAPISSIDGVRLIECCPIMKDNHPQCSPIVVDPNDFFYSGFNVTCFPVTRSAPFPSCTLDQRSQMSQVTAFIDASVTYGLTIEDATYLRALDGTGMLRKQPNKMEKVLPPYFDEGLEKCGNAWAGEFCFKAGDRRVNLHTPLMSLHTMLFREHNRIAEELAMMNPTWNEETLYQESRKIVSGMFQHIVYSEFLPPVLGPEIMAKYGLNVRTDNGRTLYNSNIDPTIRAEFSTSAFRLHSFISSIVSEFQVQDGRRLLREEQFDAAPIYNGIIGPFVKGMAKSPAQFCDKIIVTDLTEFLYKERIGKYGFDLPAVNIQRGRDHGIAPYVYLVEYASKGKIVINNFNDLYRVMPMENVEKLRLVYKDVRDIDSWEGMNYETVTWPMLMGPTMGIIIAEQFMRLKYGDRFYFEHESYSNFNQLPYFSDDQLAALKNTSLSRIVCDNTEENVDPSAKMIQKKSLLLPGTDNPIVFCSQIPGLDLAPWKV